MAVLPRDVEWFVSLYSAHFGQNIPEDSRKRLERTVSDLSPLLGDATGPVVTYVLTRSWDRDNPMSISAVISAVYGVVSEHADLLKEVWPITEGIFGKGVREDDKRIRAFAELILAIMEGKRFDKESAIQFLRELSEGL